VDTTHPLQKSHWPVGQQIKLFSQKNDLIDNNSFSSVRSVSWWTATHPLQSGQWPVGQELNLFCQNCVLVDSYSSYSIKRSPVWQQLIYFSQAVTWWRATHSLQSWQCPCGQQFNLFSQDCDLLDNNSSSSVNTVRCWPVTHPFQLRQCSCGQHILFSRKTFLLDRTHPHQSGEWLGGQQHILIIQYIVLLASWISSVKIVSWWTATLRLHPGERPGRQQLKLFRHNSVLLCSN
jgi:hypothetical protein